MAGPMADPARVYLVQPVATRRLMRGLYCREGKDGVSSVQLVGGLGDKDEVENETGKAIGSLV